MLLKCVQYVCNCIKFLGLDSLFEPFVINSSKQRHQYVTHCLCGCTAWFTHGTTDCLRNVDLALPWIDEGDHVHCWNIHTFSQTSSIRDDAFSGIRECSNELTTLTAILTAIYVANVITFKVVSDTPWFICSELLSQCNPAMKRYDLLRIDLLDCLIQRDQIGNPTRSNFIPID